MIQDYSFDYDRSTSFMPRFKVRDFKYSLFFDGADDYVDVPHNSNQLLTEGFTLSAWIFAKSVGEVAAKVIDKSNTTTGGAGFDWGVGGSNTMFFRVNGGTSRSSAARSLLFGRWNHVVVTVDAAGVVTHYINGVVSGTPAATGALSGITTTNNLTIGNRTGAQDRTFDGYIDEPTIWSRVLNVQEIVDLFYQGEVSTKGLVARFLFDEGSGTVAQDSASVANHGTINGAVYSSHVFMKARTAVT